MCNATVPCMNTYSYLAIAVKVYKILTLLVALVASTLSDLGEKFSNGKNVTN